VLFVSFVVQRPLDKLTVAFDKNNSEKLRAWFGAAPAEAVEREGPPDSGETAEDESG